MPGSPRTTSAALPPCSRSSQLPEPLEFGSLPTSERSPEVVGRAAAPRRPLRVVDGSLVACLRSQSPRSTLRRQATAAADATAVAYYPKVNAYASAPGSRKVISTVRSRDWAVLAHDLVHAAFPEDAVP